MKKTTIFFLIPTLFFAAIALLALMYARATRQQQPPVIFPTPTSAQSAIPSLPTSQKIESNGVEINNPFTGAKDYTTQGDALSVKTDTYEIAYLKNFDEFIITITSEPFEANRASAEIEFLSRLGITQSQACQLKVSISPPKKPNELTPRYGLSFCGN